MGFLELAGVRKEFAGGVVAVESFDLDAARGEFVSFLGPSGCGKTTTLRMIAGFEIPTAGDIRIDGRDVTNVPPNRRNVGMVFQSYALFPNMTVAQNIGFGLNGSAAPRRARSGPASTSCSRSSTSRNAATATRTSCRVASSSGSRWPGRSRSSRRSCSSTSRCPRSTPRSGSRSATRSARSSANWGSPPCTSPTTRRRRSNCPTASWS